MHKKITETKIIDHIGILTIKNPPQNLLEEPEFIKLEELKKWINTHHLRGMIIQGSNRHFSAGANKDTLLKKDGLKSLNERIKKGIKLLNYIENLTIPTIAAIKGACFGGGLEIALSCHIRVAGEKALIALPESELNLMPGLNGTIRLPKLVGEGKSIEVILSGEIVNSEKAHEIGIIDYVVPDKDVYDFSFDLLKKMTDNKDIDVIKSIVQSINNSRKMTFKDAIDEEMKMFCKLVIKEVNRLEKANKLKINDKEAK